MIKDGITNCHKARWRIGIKDIVLLFVTLLPFADAINGYAIDKLRLYGIGEAYHAILFGLGLFYLLRKRVRKNNYTRTLLICVFSFAIQICTTLIFGEEITSIALGRAIKILATVSFIAIFEKMTKSTTEKEFENIVLWQCKSIIVITLISDFSGICNYTYTDRGRIGLYAGSNEPTLIFSIIVIFLLWFIIRSKRTEYLIWFALGELCLILTESKSAIAIAVIFGIFLISVYLKELMGKNRTKALALLVLAIIIGIIGIQYFKSKVLDSFLFRQQYISSRLGEVNYLNYLTSGRITRFDRLIWNPFSTIINKYPLTGPVIVFIKCIFGFGLSGIMTSTFEMDYFDMFVYGGLVWLILLTKETIIIGKQVFRIQKKKILQFSYLLIIFASFFVGHLWTGGNSGIYFSLLAVFLSNYSAEQKK